MPKKIQLNTRSLDSQCICTVTGIPDQLGSKRLCTQTPGQPARREPYTRCTGNSQPGHISYSYSNGGMLLIDFWQCFQWLLLQTMKTSCSQKQIHSKYIMNPITLLSGSLYLPYMLGVCCVGTPGVVWRGRVYMAPRNWSAIRPASRSPLSKAPWTVAG